MALQFRRGNEADFVAGNLKAGEPAFTIDTFKTFVGTGSGASELLNAARYAIGNGANANKVDHAIQADTSDHASAANTADHAAAADSATSASMAVTQSPGDNSTKIATTAYVDNILRSACTVYRSTNQSTSNSASTTVTFDAVLINNDGMFSPSSPDRITIKKAGIYLVSGIVDFALNTSGSRGINLKENGTQYLAMMTIGANGTDDTRLCVSTCMPLSSNDYIQLLAFQQSGGGLNLQGGANYMPQLSVVRVG